MPYILAPYIINALIILVVFMVAWLLAQPMALLGLFFLRDMPFVVPQSGGEESPESDGEGTPMGFIQ